MNKKIWYWLCAVALVAAAVLLFFPRRQAVTYENLIRNGDFEQITNGLPQEWYTDAYFPQKSYTSYTVDAGMTGKSGHIVNYQANDARFAQTVTVSPNTLYRLHGFIKAQAVGGLGANLSVEGVYAFPDPVFDTKGEWTEVTLFGRTGPSQYSVTVYARLGGYSGEASGEAWFDDVSLNRVDAVESGFKETLWYQGPSSGEKEAAQRTGTGLLLGGSVLYAALFFLLIRWWKTAPGPNGKGFSPVAVAVLAAGFFLRLAIAWMVPGYDVDIGCFRGWADQMAASGPIAFYQDAGFCDYPPGYLWVLWLLGGLGRLFGTGVTEWMVKMPPILCDVALSALLYTQGKKLFSEKIALGLAVLYTFNPLVLVTGAAWGQADAVMLLLLFLVVLFAVQKKWAAALPLYMAAVLVKPQALMFGPLGLIALVLHGVQEWKEKDRRSALLRDVGIGLGLMIAVALAVAGPFLLKRENPLSWLIELYKGTMSQYGYVTVNACNLYFLLGKNWVPAETMADALPAVIVFCLSVLPLAAALLMGPKEEKGRQLLRFSLLGVLALGLAGALMLLYFMGRLSYAALGTVLIVYDVALFLILYFLGGHVRHLPLLGAGLLLVLFNTGTMMHERYLLPAVGLLLLAYLLEKDKRILYLTAAVSVTGFLNVGCCLDRNIRIGGAEGHLSAPSSGIASDMTALETLSAIGNTLLSGCGLYVCGLLCREDAPVHDFAPEQKKEKAAPASAAAASPRVAPAPVYHAAAAMKKADWLLMLGVTALYAVLAFTNLGSVKSPQTAWISQQNILEQTGEDGSKQYVRQNEAVILDLGQERTFTMVFFNGIHWLSDEESAEFDVQVSTDGRGWSGAYQGSARSGETYDCFSWKYVSDPAVYGEKGRTITGRYVRLISPFPELTIYEVLFRDAKTNDVLPIQSVTNTWVEQDEETGEYRAAAGQAAAENPTLPFLTDEQDTLAGNPGDWYNSTYFDEIYHARTGYEHLHGMPAYETTHPPLGKLFMSAAIAIFGMTPFGWRFAGALAGVLMLPGMYLLGKLLIRKKWGGFFAMMMMALDLMHFTQTRIATIDSFAVLFIIWATYWMLRWFFLDYFATPFKKTLLPLGLSGLCMGLAIASKWTGCYAGAGLAVLFFLGLWRRWKEVQSAQAVPIKKRTDHQGAAAEGARRLVLTVASCFLFFVAVPLAIYYLSFIPYFAPQGGVTVDKVIRSAQGMLEYHAIPGLGMDHYFYSPWYQWPVIAKPMWYYSGSANPAGMGSSIISMGNPAVWWTGLVGLFGVAALLIRRHYDEKRHALSVYTAEDDPRWAVLLICFAAQYLPWIPVPRGTYIYHYFPSVPFIILCTALCLEWLEETHAKAGRWARWGILLLAGILFVAFFPYASGITVSTRWLDAMKWFPNWLFY